MGARTLVAVALWGAPWLAPAQPLFSEGEVPSWQPVSIETGQPPEALFPAPHRRAEPPDPQQAAEHRARIERLLEGRTEQEGAAALLRRLALETTDDPAPRYVLMQMAIDAAIDAGDPAAALQLAEQMASEYAVDGPELRADLVCRALGQAAPDGPLAGIVRDALEQLLLDDRPDLASRVVLAGLEAGGICDSTELIGWSKVIGEWEEASAQAQAAALRLVQDPHDPDANLEVGRYLCFTKAQWARGLPMLAAGADESLRRLALDELAQDVGARIRAAEAWRALGEESSALTRWRLRRHADALLRAAYPLVSGLQRLEVESKLDARPLFCFGPRTEADETWQRENLHFWANHGHEGPGRWAMVSDKRGGPELVANRAGYVETLQHLPPEGVDRYVIEASIASDLLPGTALEFCALRLYTTGDGIVMENGWRPERQHTLGTGFHSYRIEGSPGRISFTLDGVHLGTMPVSEAARGPLVLRGWEGHVRCRRLEMWSAPDDSLTGYVRGAVAGGVLD